MCLVYLIVCKSWYVCNGMYTIGAHFLMLRLLLILVSAGAVSNVKIAGVSKLGTKPTKLLMVPWGNSGRSSQQQLCFALPLISAD